MEYKENKNTKLYILAFLFIFVIGIFIVVSSDKIEVPFIENEVHMINDAFFGGGSEEDVLPENPTNTDSELTSLEENIIPEIE